MGIHIKWVVGIVRGGDTLREYGDKYSTTATVHIVEDTAYVEAAVNNSSKKDPITRSDWEEFNKKLKAVGVKVVEYCRLKNGKLLKRRYEI